MKVEEILGESVKKALKEQLPVKVARESTKEVPFSRGEKKKLNRELLALWGEE